MPNLFDYLQVQFKKITDPVFSFIVKSVRYSNMKPSKHWEIVSNFTPEEFSKEINRMPYIVDKPFLFINDNSVPLYNPDIFFDKDLEDRDCDDWASMWYLYALKHKYRYITVDQPGSIFLDGGMYVVYDKENKNNTYHMTAIFRLKTGKFVVCDYTYGPTFNSFNECLNHLEKKHSFKNLEWIIYRGI